MKRLKFLLPVLILIGGCKALNQGADQPKFEETHWKLIALNQKAVNLGDKAFVDFKENKATGKAGCNSFSAGYELTSGDRVQFDPIVSTKMYCEGLMDEENQIVTNFAKVKRFEIRYGLLYLYDGNDLLMTFKK